MGDVYLGSLLSGFLPRHTAIPFKITASHQSRIKGIKWRTYPRSALQMHCDEVLSDVSVTHLASSRGPRQHANFLRYPVPPVRISDITHVQSDPGGVCFARIVRILLGTLWPSMQSSSYQPVFERTVQVRERSISDAFDDTWDFMRLCFPRLKECMVWLAQRNHL